MNESGARASAIIASPFIYNSVIRDTARTWSEHIRKFRSRSREFRTAAWMKLFDEAAVLRRGGLGQAACSWAFPGWRPRPVAPL